MCVYLPSLRTVPDNPLAPKSTAKPLRVRSQLQTLYREKWKGRCTMTMTASSQCQCVFKLEWARKQVLCSCLGFLGGSFVCPGAGDCVEGDITPYCGCGQWALTFAGSSC